MLTRRHMHDYQNKMVAFTMDTPKAALFAEMGLGKTVASLTLIRDLIHYCDAYRVLIIAPKRVAQHTWPDEVGEWSHTAHLDNAVIKGTVKQRTKIVDGYNQIQIINRENVDWLVTYFGQNWPYDLVIVDESSSFKNHSSTRFKALKRVRNLIDRIVLLTGTPTSNGMHDLWSQIYLLDGGKRLGKNITAFRKRWFEQDWNGHTYSVRDEECEDEILDAISDICFTLKTADYLKMPERIDRIVKIEMPAKARAAYRELEKEFLLELEEYEAKKAQKKEELDQALLNEDYDEHERINEEIVIVAPTMAVLSNKLLQACNGAVYYDKAIDDSFETERDWTALHDAKLDALETIIESANGTPVLVAYAYQSDCDRIMARFKEAVNLKDVDNVVEEWNSGKIPLLLAHPACLTGDTEVLTENRGWLKITDVKLSDRVFDGCEFVSHVGCRYSGEKEIIEVFDICMTPNHKVLVNNQWREAKNVGDSESTRSKARYTYTGNDSYLSEMFKVRYRFGNNGAKLQKAQQKGFEILQKVYRRFISQNDRHSFLADLARNEESNTETRHKRLRILRWTRHRDLRPMVAVRQFLRRYGCNLPRWIDHRTYRCERGLLPEQLQMDTHVRSASKQEKQSLLQIQRCESPSCRTVQNNEIEPWEAHTETERRDERGRSRKRCNGFNIPSTSKIKEKVYDLVDCGKRNRFVIRNRKGEVFISHNSAGHGLNIQKGGNVMVWFGLTWSLELYQQFNARLHRQGQKLPVFIYHLLMTDTVEDTVMARLGEKFKTQEKVMNAFVEEAKRRIAA